MPQLDNKFSTEHFTVAIYDIIKFLEQLIVEHILAIDTKLRPSGKKFSAV
ncbi:MAG: hypothetical protein HQL23_04025 [Candidatus Omnitrophica bacterium]|nr:hypothetical protein [Candidatus Omnitrophota bacterium]